MEGNVSEIMKLLPIICATAYFEV